MTKQEFLDTLARILGRELSNREVADNIQYYGQYIDQKIREGRTETEVLEELGDPRLIARTILQVDQQREETEGYGAGNIFGKDEADYGTDTVFEEAGDGSTRYQDPEELEREMKKAVRSAQLKLGIILLLVLVAAFFILGTIFTILWKLLPILLIVAAVLWIYRRFFS